ncbi:hypothetical protein [Streptomyces sp. TRM68416]|uniref:hypothetical protein n=1 Tax=Streptomyces sp. TRM68416 TaxID=2758412 RepID=UPI0016619736|nr:hypothetical protein [Streptomyces sp. TRM68416]MBD0837396.1 hypothetical protein [Streptomyces sp. TRM68416]
MTRAEIIAGVLHHPVLDRPVLGRELRERLVQGLGAGSTAAEWTATVPQLADALDTALTVHDVITAAASAGTVAAGHALVIQYQGADLVGVCQCGRPVGRVRPGAALDALAVPWERHISPAHARASA